MNSTRRTWTSREINCSSFWTPTTTSLPGVVFSDKLHQLRRRVTDYIDIRTCDVIMKSFYRPAIFEKDYPFEPSGTYRSIDPDPDDPHKSYMDYIETLPLTAGPAIFGMHENANISLRVHGGHGC